jgi:hypothetical protein
MHAIHAAAHSYKARETAGTKLLNVLAEVGLDPAVVRYFVGTRADGRFVPCVLLDANVAPVMVTLAYRGVTILG